MPRVVPHTSMRTWMEVWRIQVELLEVRKKIMTRTWNLWKERQQQPFNAEQPLPQWTLPFSNIP